MFKPWRPHPCRDTRFQLIDEHGAGAPYAGLAYELVDRYGQVHHGYLDAKGAGKAGKQIAGPVAIRFTQAHDRSRAVYSRLMDRPHYPLHITELQARVTPGALQRGGYAQSTTGGKCETCSTRCRTST